MNFEQHPIDVALQQLADNADPAERLDVVWSAYSDATGLTLDNPPTEEQREQVHSWLRNLRIGTTAGSSPSFISKRPRLALTGAEDLVSKWSYLAQLDCGSCRAVPDREGNLGYVLPIQVEPWSAQSQRTRNKMIKDAVSEALRQRWGDRRPVTEQSMCVSVAALVGKTGRRKDADNLLKGLLDSLTSLAWQDDSQIQCLTSRRVEYAGKLGMYLVKYRAVDPWNADVVWDDPTPPKNVWGSSIRV